MEPEYRGQGLGRAVAGRVLGLLGGGVVAGRDWEGGGNGFAGMEGEIAAGRVWSFSHCSVENWGSIGVARGLGGRETGREYWVGVDLSVL